MSFGIESSEEPQTTERTPLMLFLLIIQGCVPFQPSHFLASYAPAFRLRAVVVRSALQGAVSKLWVQ